ncbi:hypothetical protein [Planomonospora venezuelensis]|uniref:PIN domain-containing protein n=1 Tax=Planomonospora venezuelensis TaxID=1999 RepID=A0A841D9H4_PLAVE|nr:hypothetical protein [Planomonospora venezuelensis]MBB5967272.1 hypothetical protein [Planomonospora venezuelensis]GIM98574.1 hypothetical protein Pve01_02330 [Planomonospora venezuelensis]
MIGGYVADLTAVLRILADDRKDGRIRVALETIAEDGHTLLLPVTTLVRAGIIAEPHPEQLMWLYGFRATQVADLSRQEGFRVMAQSRFASRPDEVTEHDAQTAYLAMMRGWPVLTADPARWTGYEHLELVQV